MHQERYVSSLVDAPDHCVYPALACLYFQGLRKYGTAVFSASRECIKLRCLLSVVLKECVQPSSLFWAALKECVQPSSLFWAALKECVQPSSLFWAALKECVKLFLVKECGKLKAKNLVQYVNAASSEESLFFYLRLKIRFAKSVLMNIFFLFFGTRRILLVTVGVKPRKRLKTCLTRLTRRAASGGGGGGDGGRGRRGGSGGGRRDSDRNLSSLFGRWWCRGLHHHRRVRDRRRGVPRRTGQREGDLCRRSR